MTQHANQSTSDLVTKDMTDDTGRLDIHKLLEKTVTGTDPEQAAYGSTGNLDTSAAEEFSEDLGSPLDTLEQELDAEGTEQEAAATSEAPESLTEDSEPSLDKMLDSEELAQDATAEALDIETVYVKNEEGRKQKLEVNYSDKAAIKQAYIKAAGMRKFQAERDNAKKELSELQSKHTELNDTYSKLDDAFQKDGIKGVVTLLGGPEAINTFIEDELKHREYLEGLSPSEKLRLEMEEKEKSYQSQLALEKTKREEFEQRVKAREEEAALRALESKIRPAFDRYRFSGKLNDPVIENQLDSAIWQQVNDRLSEYPDEVELTQALIDKEFRTVSSNFKKIINNQAEKTVKKTIDTKKADATQRAQVAAKKGLATNADKSKFIADMKSGNIQDAFGAMFSGKVKL